MIYEGGDTVPDNHERRRDGIASVSPDLAATYADVEEKDQGFLVD